MSFRRYAHAPLGTLRKILAARLGGARVPLIANLALTYRCNLRCQYCGIWRSPPAEMDTATVRSVIDQLAAAGTERLGIGGGEPMLRDDIGAIIDHAKGRGLTVNLLSNGWQVPERIDALRQLDFLAVSLDGPAAVHDRLRGDGAFARALAAIRAARAARIAVWTTTVLTRHNLDAIDAVLQLARQEGARASFLPVAAESLKARNAAALAPDPEALAAAMDRLLDERRRPGSPLAASASLLRFYRRHWGRPQAAHGRPGAFHAGSLPCQAARLFCAIGPDGRLYPCLYRQDQDPGASIPELGFAAAWQAVRPPQCAGCWCDSFIEGNLIFRFDPGAMLNAYRLLADG